MSAPDISIDLGSLAIFVEDRVLKFFGKDAETAEWNSRLSRRLRVAIEHAQSVQCVGMARPVRIQDIYQPLDLHQKDSNRSSSIWDLIDRRCSAVIFAGPGFGKSTLLSYVCVQLLEKPQHTPFLFVLRSAQAVDDLEEFVSRLSAGRRPKLLAKAGIPVLLVDGYDEISTPNRLRVSESLAEFSSLKIGPYYLTCRSFYDVYELRTKHFNMGTFTTKHQLGFIKAFSQSYSVPINAQELVAQLRSRGLDDLGAHPLTLTLICILKCGAFPDLPDNSLALLKRAFDMLTLRWDQQKGVSREAHIPLDGEERIKCLMRVAYKMTDLRADQGNVERSVREHLYLSQREGINAREVLLDIARWYGVLVPTELDTWEFVHRSVHDYLAARFWVESGSFRASSVKEWNARAAYAACLSPNATETLVRALRECEELHTVAECLRNKPAFNVDEVASAIVYHFSRFSKTFLYHRDEETLSVHTIDNIFSLASEPLLLSSIRCSMSEGSRHLFSKASDFVCAYAMAQILQRKHRINDQTICALLLRTFCTPSFRFVIGADENSQRFCLEEIFARTFDGC